MPTYYICGQAIKARDAHKHAKTENCARAHPCMIAAPHLVCSRPPDLAHACHAYLRRAVKELLTALLILRRHRHGGTPRRRDWRGGRGGLLPREQQGAAATALPTRIGNEYLQPCDQPMPRSDDDTAHGDGDFDTRDERLRDSSPPAARAALRSFHTSNVPSFKDLEPFHMKQREDWPGLYQKILATLGLTYSWVLVNASDIS